MPDNALQAAVTPMEGAARVGPPLSTYSLVTEALRASDALGVNLYPWQSYALDVALSCEEDRSFIYREVAIICSRQNGKSEILLPRIKWALENGRRVIHTAQNRLLPRKVFMRLARHYEKQPGTYIRKANGQEEISLMNGGSYVIVAPQRGARGLSGDDLIIDELREFEDFDFIAAAEPTLTESLNPQVLYLSNAGTDLSVVLNDLRDRRDPALAYMEWSAHKDRAIDDREGWLEANPIIGHGKLTLERLQQLYEKYREAGELSIFETEHLCRWVRSMRPRLVQQEYWLRCRGKVSWPPVRPALGVNVDAQGKRASAALAWMQTDGKIALTVVGDVSGDPVDVTRFGVELQEKATELGWDQVAFDPWTDQHLARHFSNTKAVNGPEYANASERFVRLLETGGLVSQWADAVAEQLPHASRRETSSDSWMAEKGTVPVTAVLAAIRAVWLAANPRLSVGEIY
jgi:hypothetical protein